jgi:hypothetical protein
MKSNNSTKETKLNPLWVKMAKKLVKDAELRIVIENPIPPQGSQDVKPSGFVI